jgi:hypothetical protein
MQMVAQNDPISPKRAPGEIISTEKYSVENGHNLDNMVLTHDDGVVPELAGYRG